MLRHCYLTTRCIDRHPIGSRCFAFRIDGGRKLAMEFFNGDVIKVDYPSLSIDVNGRLHDLEDDLVPLWEDGPRKTLDGEVIEPINELIMELKREARIDEANTLQSVI